MTLFELICKWSSDETLMPLNKLNSTMDKWSEFENKLIEAYTAFGNWWQEVFPQICKTITNIVSPDYADERNQNLIQSHLKWGEYGWTFNNKTTLSAFTASPVSLEDADQIMGQYCTLENISMMAQDLMEYGVNAQDLDEALFCFANQKYKAGVLILFALIDHVLVSKGYKSKPRNGQKEGYYLIGNSAIREYKTQNQEGYNNSNLFANLFFLNIIATLATLFQNGENFATEPAIVNRNFVSHGMSKRVVTQIDCFKVWSALYSLVTILPELEAMKQ